MSPLNKAIVALVIVIIIAGLLIAALAALGKLGTSKDSRGSASMCSNDSDCSKLEYVCSRNTLAKVPTCVDGRCSCKQSVLVVVTWTALMLTLAVGIVVVAQMLWLRKQNRSQR